MSLKEIISVLESYDPSLTISPAFGTPHSWRGSYDELGFKPVESATVGDMLANAQSAVNQQFEGYKGGLYTMDETTPCHISEYSKYPGIPISGEYIKNLCELAKLNAKLEETTTVITDLLDVIEDAAIALDIVRSESQTCKTCPAFDIAHSITEAYHGFSIEYILGKRLTQEYAPQVYHLRDTIKDLSTPEINPQ
jgi:hypothetical protein